MSDDKAEKIEPEKAPEKTSEKALANKQKPALSPEDAAVLRKARRRSRRSFIVAGLAALGGYGGWHWLTTRREDNGIPWPLRRAHEINEQLARDYFNRSRLAPTFPPEMAEEPRVNGDEGMSGSFDPEKWQLQVMGLADLSSNAATDSGDSGNSASDDSDNSSDNTDDNQGGEDTDSDDSDDSDAASGNSDAAAPIMVTLDDIKKLPRVEMVTQLKCIEGWSVIVRWAGARFADFAAKYPPTTRSGDPPDVLNKPDDLVGYVQLITPNGGYYVGLEMDAMLHPQTLLCYEMNGKPLTLEHGAPLRLVTPLKYGIKNIKRIAKIIYTDRRPADYWAEQGYDWYSGH